MAGKFGSGFGWQGGFSPGSSGVPQRTPSGGGAPAQKGFVSAPSAHSLQGIVGQPSHRASVSKVTPLQRQPAEIGVADSPQRPAPLLFAIVLPGPGADRLRAYAHELAPELDRESGDLVHWAILGDPRRTRMAGQRFLDQLGTGLGDLKGQWQNLLAQRADADDLVAEETTLIAQEYGLKNDDLPVVLFVEPELEGMVIPFRLPPSLLDSVEKAKQVFSLLRRHLDQITHTKASGKPVLGLLGGLQLALAELKQGPLADEIRDQPNELKKHAAVNLVREGSTVTDAADRVGLSRAALYKDPRIGAQTKAAGSARRRTAREKRMRVEDAPASSNCTGDGDE